jgi:hypothetical protein
MNQLGVQLCEQTLIDIKTLIPRKLDHFEQSHPDKEIARLHQHHHQMRRFKNLLRIRERMKLMNGDAIDSYGTQINQRFDANRRYNNSEIV